jgi:hypothetical protein
MLMTTHGVGPGDEVEAWCTRCRMNLNHVVVAVVGTGIEKVQCLTCNGYHKYYVPKREGSRPSKGGSASDTPGSGRSLKVDKTAASRDKAGREWATAMREMPGQIEPVPYRVQDSYGADDFIQHPVFGTGKVLDILGRDKIEVVFEGGKKILICNRKQVQ